MALFFLQPDRAMTSAPDPARGNAIAGASGFLYALTLAGFRWVAKRPGPDAGVATVVLGNAIAFFAALPMALPVTTWSTANAAVILYLGIVQIGLAYVFITRAMPHVTAFEANAILLLDPALSPVWAWLVEGERPGRMAIAGGAVILGATLVHTLRRASSNRSPAHRT
jgi:drug/metabolite transporter (DMT)-like permease